MKRMIKSPSKPRAGKTELDEIDRLIQQASPPVLSSVLPRQQEQVSEATALREKIDQLMREKDALTALLPNQKATASVAATTVPVVPGEYRPELDVQLDQIEVPGSTIVATVYSYNKGAAKVQLVRRYQGKWSKLGRLKASELEALVQVLREIERVHNTPEEMGGQP